MKYSLGDMYLRGVFQGSIYNAKGYSEYTFLNTKGWGISAIIISNNAGNWLELSGGINALINDNFVINANLNYQIDLQYNKRYGWGVATNISFNI